MKTEFDQFGNFEFIPETGQDIVWLEMFTENLKEYKHLAKHFTWDLEDGCVIDDGHQAKEIEIHQVLDADGDVWGEIEKVSFKINI